MQVSVNDMLKKISFEDYDNILEYTSIIEAGIKAKWNEYLRNNAKAEDDSYLDDYREILQMFKYRMELMTICCLSELWEQDLVTFLKKNNIPLNTDKNVTYKVLQKTFKDRFGYSLDENTTIVEMRSLVNSIKHGEGSSFQELKNICGDDILADSCMCKTYNGEGEPERYKEIHFDSNTLTSKTLNVKDRITEYHDAIIDFWNVIFKKLDEK